MEVETYADLTETEKYSYPGLLQRVKALGIDYCMLLLVFVLSYNLIDFFGGAQNYVRGGVLIFMFFLYEPLMVCFFGGTVGHYLMKLRVRDHEDPSRKILLPLAFFRFIVKSLLGWLSFFSIGFNDRRRAIHDFAGWSVVIEVK